MSLPNSAQIGQFAGLLALGICGGFIAFWLRIPLPFMIGGLFAALPMVVRARLKGVDIYQPRKLRNLFVGMIGTMIGSTVTPDIVAAVPGLTMSLIGMAIFVPIAQGAGYFVCRQVGGYDRPTALFASMPGGLVEAIEMGRRHGGDPSVLILSHFLRIVFVVTLVPFGFLLWSGDSVGSGGGQSLSVGEWGLWDIFQVVAIAVIGGIVGRLLRLPAAHLVGPMVLSAVLHGTGIAVTSSPNWLLYVSQLVVGVGLATQFKGATPALFFRVLGTTFCLVLAFAIIAIGFAVALTKMAGIPVYALILSFAPGGVTEMGLIALSLALSPMIVTAHHVFRIFWTVSFAALMGRWTLNGADERDGKQP